MKKIILIICLGLILTPSLQGQNLRAYEKAGDEALAKGLYFSAYTYFQTTLEIDETLPRLQYKFAKSAYHWQSYEEAKVYFQKASTDKKIIQEFPLFNYEWGLTEMALGNYNEAKLLFLRFLKTKGITSSNRKAAKNKIKACEAAHIIVQKPIEIEISHPDKTINSPYSDFGAIKKDGILYLSALKFKTKNKGKEQYFSRIMTANEGEKAKTMRRNININGFHNAHTTFSHNGEWMYFTRCENLKEGGIRCKIYRRNLIQKRAKDELLPALINMEEFTATQPSIGFDSVSKKEFLFFISDRKGGKGGLDIWSSEITSDGKFLKPKNLGRNINTVGDEVTPFYHNQFLYFSSNFHIGLGGFDIFKTKKINTSQWQKPINMGFPLNSSYNDIYLSWNEDGYSGYFSSNRKGAFLLTKSACCNDIFAFQLPKPSIEEPIPAQPDSLIIAEKSIDSSSFETNTITEQPKEILTFDEELSKMLPISLYFDNDQPNPKTLKTSTDINYQTTYFQYYNRKPLFIQKYTAPLSISQKEDASLLLYDFFENDVKFGYDKLNRLIELLVIELNKGRKIDIYIKGYTSQLAGSDYNINLSKRRISSVINYLKEVNSQALLYYISSMLGN